MATEKSTREADIIQIQSMPAESFPVESFAVCHDVVVDGQRILNAPLSREFSTMEEALQARTLMLSDHPGAGIRQSVRYF